ncbi:SusC/RagA family TonB-linked outer membrane protein [Carboxylicivirga sp. N1Y90]|uniref:SusC/RagA family TonB-linked outer membrane protein n=1 Tax=Carboxylicivirga fragile TaxID=3417571 RepID=UPI003D34554B|nr:SusC/RagA family TonB-linked outer membrane protein [Marinilabiliaceae bacterium N1Y90]
MKKNVSWFKRYLLLIPTFILGLFVYAQDLDISGTVTSSDDGQPMPGVSVVQKGTTNGTITDITGAYAIRVPQGSTIIYSFIGMASQEVVVASSEILNISLVSEAEGLDEIVVTALGIKREKKSLGYSVQEVQGESLLEARENNVANAIVGKVSGLQVVKSSNGPASSSKIILRGNNSLGGDNQPLIVVDGIPMDNFTGAANNDYWNPSPDMGNGLGDLNPEDIESMSVLKGASAAALYGSRAGNGVILITTKTGKAKKGVGITYNVTVGFENLASTPEFQDEFGQGADGIYDELSGSSWGPKIAGQDVPNWEGVTVPLRAYDNLGAFVKTGVNQTHNVSFQQQVTDGTSLYSSLTYLNDDSKIPGAKLERTNLLTRSVSNFGENKKWTLDVKVQYINSKAKNRPINGSNISNGFGTMYMLPRSIDVTNFENHTDEFGNMIWYTPSNAVNPYWAADNNLNFDNRDRFLLNGVLKYQFTNWLTGEVRGGADLYTTSTESKLYAGSPLSSTGRYSLGKKTFIEKNYNALLTAQKDNLFGRFGGSVSIGGNLMSQESSGISSSAGELEVPNLFSLNNGKSNPTVGQTFHERKMNSLYGTMQINYDAFVFVDVTGRNDWSSTLSKDNRSFFYPSVSTSLVFSELIDRQFDLPSWFNFGKIRASFATVGNDLDPYKLYNHYTIGKDPNGNTTASNNSVKYNSDLKSELIKSTEFGIDARFFNNRLAVDFSWYKSNATNQLIQLDLDPTSGYNGEIVNAGNIQNKGFELMLNGEVLKLANGFQWDMNLNYSKNENTIVELTEDVKQYGLGGYDNVAILAVAGGGYGEIWGTKFARVEDELSKHYGSVIVDSDGNPTATSEKFLLGNQQPDAMLGFSNTFSYKNLSFSFLIDARIGGEMFSGTNRALQSVGNAAETVVNGAREDIVYDGVVSNGSGGYTVNTTAVSPQAYWQTITSRSGNLGIGENNIYDATNVRLRNVSLNYVLPQKWIANTVFQSVKAGVSANNVWLITSHLNGVDPESVYSTSTNAVGFENLSAPTSRTIFFNLSVSF